MSEKIFLHVDTPLDLVGEQLALLRFDPIASYEPATFPSEIEFRATDRPDTSVHYIQNRQIEVNYLSIKGPDAILLQHDLEKALDHYDRKTIFQNARSNPHMNERMTALFQLSILRLPVPEPDVLGLLAEFLAHPKPGVRKSAVLAIAYFEWPEAIAMLDDLIKRETDPDVLGQARELHKQAHARPSPWPITGYERVMAQSGTLSERIWAEKWLDGRYLVSSIPQIVYNLSLGDRVEVESRNGELTITHRQQFGHQTVRVDIGADSKREQEVVDLVRESGARIEFRSAGRGAIDIPLSIDDQKLIRALAALGVSPEVTDEAPTQPNVGFSA